MCPAGLSADAEVEIDVNPAAPQPVVLYKGLNLSGLQLRSIEFSPVARDSTNALAAASQQLNERQRASVRSVLQLRLSESPDSVQQFRALKRFGNLRSLSLWR